MLIVTCDKTAILQMVADEDGSRAAQLLQKLVLLERNAAGMLTRLVASLCLIIDLQQTVSGPT